MSGFASPNYTQTPNDLFDHIMPDLTHAELLCLLYIIRRTIGWRRDGDRITLEEFCHGRVRPGKRRLRDGTTVDTPDEQSDRGTGLCKSVVCKALAALEAKGLVNRVRTIEDGLSGPWRTTYTLNVQRELGKVLSTPTDISALDMSAPADKALSTPADNALEGLSTPADTLPYREKKKTELNTGRQRNARESSQSCDAPQTACLPANEQDDFPSEEIRRLLLKHGEGGWFDEGATAAIIRSVKAEPRLPDPVAFVRDWTEFMVRSMRAGRSYRNPAGFLRQMLCERQPTPTAEQSCLRANHPKDTIQEAYQRSLDRASRRRPRTLEEILSGVPIQYIEEDSNGPHTPAISSPGPSQLFGNPFQLT